MASFRQAQTNTESLSVSLSAMYLLTSDEKVVPCTLDAGNDLLFIRVVDLPTSDDFDFVTIVDRDGEEYPIQEWFIQRETRRCIVLCAISDFFADEEEDGETSSEGDSDQDEEESIFDAPSEFGDPYSFHQELEELEEDCAESCSDDDEWPED